MCDRFGESVGISGDVDQLIVPADVFVDAADGGDAVINMAASMFVLASFCSSPSFISVSVEYDTPGISSDANNNGIPDECECPADLDGNGNVGVSDLLILLAAWGPCPGGCTGDLDADEVVGVGDLLILLAGWGSCA